VQRGQAEPTEKFENSHHAANDTAALLHFADSIGVDVSILRAAVTSNNQLRSRDESLGQ
jgi:hypothetical protein